MKLLLEENRNHVWGDLFRLVDVECKNGLYNLLRAFFRLEVDSDVNMPQIGRGEQEPLCGVISPG